MNTLFACLASHVVAALFLPTTVVDTKPQDNQPEPTVIQPTSTPSPASDVPVLELNRIYQMPVGDRGLEFTDAVKALQGKKVRVQGYMVMEDRGNHGHWHSLKEKGIVAGRFMLAPLPVKVSYPCFGLSEDLPPQTVFVTVPEFQGKPVPYTATPLLLTGTLSIGNREEPDGRISSIRLALDPSPELTAKASKIEAGASGHDHQHEGEHAHP